MKKACVIGNPIDHSKSPIIHNHWLQILGLKGSYTKVLAPLDAFEETVRELIKDGFSGANVTIPFKEIAYQIADEKTAIAEQMSAANTLIFKDNKIIADNTDGFGFGQNILKSVPSWNLNGRHLVLGAGGAARAIVVWLLNAGAREILLANRTLERAVTIAKIDQRVRPIAWHEIDLEPITTLINTTSRGMKGENDIDLDFSGARKDLIVNDIVYTPLETKLLRDARAAGCQVVDGLGMLLWQARPGFTAWFGQEPPPIDNLLREKVLSA